MESWAFPRLKSRGPIEADIKKFEQYSAMVIFPRLKSRGPIEACQYGRLATDALVSFPRLKSRGPIEAAGRAYGVQSPDAISTAEKSWPH